MRGLDALEDELRVARAEGRKCKLTPDQLFELLSIARKEDHWTEQVQQRIKNLEAVVHAIRHVDQAQDHLISIVSRIDRQTRPEPPGLISDALKAGLDNA